MTKTRTLAAMAGAWLALALPADAQPTTAQQDAIRNSCRSDFLSNCSGVPRGGAEAVQCLQRNSAKLSPACRTAVDAISPKPAPAAAPAQPASPPAAAAPPRAAAPPAPATPSAATPAASASPPTAEQQGAMRQACSSDFMANCSGVTPGGAEALQCLQRNAARLSPACNSAVSAIAPKAAAAPAASPSTAPAAPPAAPPARTAAPTPPAAAPARAATPPATAAAPSQPTAAQQDAIRTSCRSDFMAKCSGVTPGGAEAVQCLQRNSATLAPACRTAVAAIGAPAAASPSAAAPAAAPPPPPPAAAVPSGNIPPRIALMIGRGCALERRTVCDLPAGDGRILTCLAANQDKLTPGCKSALTQARAAAGR